MSEILGITPVMELCVKQERFLVHFCSKVRLRTDNTAKHVDLILLHCEECLLQQNIIWKIQKRKRIECKIGIGVYLCLIKSKNTIHQSFINTSFLIPPFCPHRTQGRTRNSWGAVLGNDFSITPKVPGKCHGCDIKRGLRRPRGSAMVVILSMDWGDPGVVSSTIKKLRAKSGDTVNFLNIRTPKTFVVITLKVEQDGFSLE